MLQGYYIAKRTENILVTVLSVAATYSVCNYCYYSL